MGYSKEMFHWDDSFEYPQHRVGESTKDLRICKTPPLSRARFDCQIMILELIWNVLLSSERLFHIHLNACKLPVQSWGSESSNIQCALYDPTGDRTHNLTFCDITVPDRVIANTLNMLAMTAFPGAQDFGISITTDWMLSRYMQE